MIEVLRSRRLRVLLAIDVVATVLAGLLVSVRPAWLAARIARPVRVAPRTIHQLGLAVAVLGVSKGLVYAAAVGRACGTEN